MSQQTGEQIVRTAFAEAFQLTKEDCRREVTSHEKAIVTCSVFFALVQMIEEQQYRYPNKIGRAAGILALVVLANEHLFKLPSIRNGLGLPTHIIKRQLIMAANKEVNDEWETCTGRVLIVGTRRALYAIGGLDPDYLNGQAILAAAQWLQKNYHSFGVGPAIGQEMTTLLNHMGELSGTDTFEEIYSVS